MHQGLLDAEELLELAVEEDDEDSVESVASDLDQYESIIAGLEFRRMFSGEMDPNNAFLDIQAGSGGTEAQDWAAMLERMYLRWGERRGFKTELVEESAGEVAGIKSATIRFEGEYAYGWLRTETGVHRLVRKSPFDSGNRRHTSFSSVFVSPEVDDNIDIDINPADLKTDVYRASGAGGQHVNKTDSAVRITHLPTGVVAASQQERSQHRNREIAMRILRSRLLEAKQRAATEKYEAERRSQVGTGDRSERIRTYNFPQNRITDHRYGLSWHNLPAMFDGDLQQMFDDIHASEATRRLEAELAKA